MRVAPVLIGNWAMTLTGFARGSALGAPSRASRPSQPHIPIRHARKLYRDRYRVQILFDRFGTGEASTPSTTDAHPFPSAIALAATYSPGFGFARP